MLTCGAAVAPAAPADAAAVLRDDGRVNHLVDDDDGRPAPKPKPPKPNPKPPKPPKDPPPGKVPTKKVRGKYVLKIAGFYTGSGEAHATGAGIKISGKVKDPKGVEFKLDSKGLDVVNDRFRGTGTLDSMEVEIDGRLDAKDDNNGDVLKNGRITLTFRTSDGHSSRAAGDLREKGE